VVEAAAVRNMDTEHDFFMKLFKGNERKAKLNLDKIRKHIINCIVALNVRSKLNEHEVMKQHVFVNAVQLLVKEDTKETDVHLLLNHFGRTVETCKTCDWYPLHWAAVLGDKIKEDIVHALFHSSPSCSFKHLDMEGKNCRGITPVDLLVARKNPNMSLIHYFDLQCPSYFTSAHNWFPGFYHLEFFPLHYAVQHSESSELLQYLIQSHLPAVTYKGTRNHDYYPLSLLVRRPDFPTFYPMLQCLLDANSDSNILGAAIKIENTGRILKLLEILLNANPSAANSQCYSGSTPFHFIGFLKDPICALSVMKLLLVHHPSGLEVTVNNSGRLPIHSAIERSTVEVVKFM
jgi:hypothetical protein